MSKTRKGIYAGGVKIRLIKGVPENQIWVSHKDVGMVDKLQKAFEQMQEKFDEEWKSFMGG